MQGCFAEWGTAVGTGGLIPREPVEENCPLRDDSEKHLSIGWGSPQEIMNPHFRAVHVDIPSWLPRASHQGPGKTQGRQ